MKDEAQRDAVPDSPKPEQRASDKPTRKVSPDSASATAGPVVAPPRSSRVGMRWQEVQKVLAEGKIIVNIAGGGVMLVVRDNTLYARYGEDNVFDLSKEWTRIGPLDSVLPPLTEFELGVEAQFGAEAPLWWTCSDTGKGRRPSE